VSVRTPIKNKVHAILSKNGISIEYSDIFGKKTVKYLKSLNLRFCYKQGMDGYLRLIETLNELIKEVTDTIKGRVEDNLEAKLLTTIPGVSLLLSSFDNKRDKGHIQIFFCKEALFICRVSSICTFIRWQDISWLHNEAGLKMAPCLPAGREVDNNRAVVSFCEGLREDGRRVS